MAIFGQTTMAQITWLSIHLDFQPILLVLNLVSICTI